MVAQAVPVNGLDQNGVTLNGVSWSWDDFNNHLSEEQRHDILIRAGLQEEQATSVLGALRTMEQGEYAATQKKKQEQRTRGSYWDQIRDTVTDPIGTVTGGMSKGLFSGTRDYATPEELYKSSGLAGIVKSVGEQNKYQQAVGPSQPQQGATPAFSKESLDNYVSSYLMPLQANMEKMISGDMAAWKAGIDKTAAATGMSGDKSTQIFRDQAAREGPMYDMMGQLMLRQHLTQPYTDLVNSLVGNQVSIGQKLMAMGGTGANVAYLMQDPQFAALVTGAGGGLTAGLGTGSSLTPQGILGAIGTQSPITQMTPPYGATGGR